MREVWFYLFVAAVGAFGLLNVTIPDRVVAFRRTRHWREGWLSGGPFYATAIRVRLMGFVFLVLAVLLLLLGIPRGA